MREEIKAPEPDDLAVVQDDRCGDDHELKLWRPPHLKSGVRDRASPNDLDMAHCPRHLLAKLEFVVAIPSERRQGRFVDQVPAG